MRYELADHIEIGDPTKPDEKFGCVSVTVSVLAFVDDEPKPQKLSFTGTSRRSSHALAFALEGLAAQLMKSTV